MSAAVIVALDGMLANHEHRRVPGETDIHWREKFDQVQIEEDAQNRDLVRLSNNCREHNSLTIVLERPCIVMEVACKWLGDTSVEFKILYMKPGLKQCSTTDVKASFIQTTQEKKWSSGCL